MPGMQAALCSIDWDKLVRVFSALLTPTIALAAVLIAYQQRRISERQARLALFDKRLAVFHSTRELIGAVFRDARADLNQLFKFASETMEHEFLFGEDISAYMDELWKKGLEIQAHVATRGEPARVVELVTWFHDQGKESTQKFKKYMHFPEP